MSDTDGSGTSGETAEIRGLTDRESKLAVLWHTSGDAPGEGEKAAKEYRSLLRPTAKPAC